MQCPYCQTENRDDEDKCYHCERDLAMLRLIVNKAKHHYNQGLELADRNKNEEAIAEMKNALDLDARLVNARVVLGTLYAKLERFDEAKRCWAETLALDHRYQRAHEYLAKADAVEQALPSIKRQRKITLNLVYALAAMICISAILVAAQIFRGGTPPPETPVQPAPFNPRAADGKVDDNATSNAVAIQPPPVIPASPDNEGQNDAELQKLSAQLDSAKEQTRMRDNQIKEFQKRLLELADKALNEGDDSLALQLVADYGKSTAGQGQQADRAANIKSQALDRMTANYTKAVDGFFAGTIEYDRIDAQGKMLLAAAGEAPQAAEIRQMIARVDKAYGDKLVNEAGPKIKEASIKDAVNAAIEVKTVRPDVADQIDAALGSRLEAETTSLTARVKRLASNGEFDLARRRIADLTLQMQPAGQAKFDSAMAALKSDVDHKQAGAQLAKLDESAGAKQWADVQQGIASVDRAVLDDAGQKHLDELQDRARKGKALADWAWFQELDPKFTDGRISAEEAKRATDNYRSTIENLPTAQQYAKAPILFYAASAAFKLGDPAKSAALLAEIEAMPNIPRYIKSSVKDFRKSHAKELGLPATAETPAAKSDSAATSQTDTQKQ